MTKRPIKDMAASVKQRLTDVARETGRPFQEVLQYYAMERFLYRLAQAPQADKFILKGALMLAAWQAPISRPTKDIDLLGRTTNSVAAIIKIVRAFCTHAVEPDGLSFDPTTVTGAAITEDADYSGVRVTFQGFLKRSRIPMQIDIGFGDVVFPAARLTDYPTILDFPAPRLRGYSRETAVAEKYEAMVKLGPLNSRMKDFFDIWLLARQFEFDGTRLATAITKTFANRNTPVTEQPIALTPAFGSDPMKQRQWQGFVRKSRLEIAPERFIQVTDACADFLLPVSEAISSGRSFDEMWKPSGPWQQH